jgi:hypothetical protein
VKVKPVSSNLNQQLFPEAADDQDSVFHSRDLLYFTNRGEGDIIRGVGWDSNPVRPIDKDVKTRDRRFYRLRYSAGTRRRRIKSKPQQKRFCSLGWGYETISPCRTMNSYHIRPRRRGDIDLFFEGGQSTCSGPHLCVGPRFKIWRRGWDSHPLHTLKACKLLIVYDARIAQNAQNAQNAQCGYTAVTRQTTARCRHGRY